VGYELDLEIHYLVKKTFFEQKISGPFSYEYTYMWAQVQVKIPSINLLAYTVLSAKMAVKNRYKSEEKV
jgi:hypothetical protein